jgi:dolichol-phosphate mannosyltransferase
VLSFSDAPIRFISLLGIIIFIIGIIYSILFRYFYAEVPFNGGAPIILLILLIGGLQLLIIGEVGKYLWRILEQTRNKELFVINVKVEKKD